MAYLINIFYHYIKNRLFWYNFFMIEQESIENLKNMVDIVDVISGYIELKKAGANFKANCPFHGENTPSFVVSPAKQIYHCFGCGVGGDTIKFVMEYEKLNYPEAIEKLASQYNIDLRYSQKMESNSTQKRIIENLNLFFRKNLDHFQDAKEYLKSRGIYESTIEKFEIGYAPESFKTLEYLKKESISYSDAKEVGVIAKGDDNRVYARFSQRVTFPIFTPNGKAVGFGGRTITNHPAKYINSPQSKIFDKSKLLYGYHKAKTSILQKGEVIVTEGYLDVIMLHQAGFTNTVASLGTALTSYHIPILNRGDPKVILAYDGDRPGLEAAFKAASMLSQRSINGGVVIFTDGTDPADMVKNHQSEELKRLFRDPKPFIEYVLEYIVSKYNIKEPLQKERAIDEATKYLQKLSPVLQSEYRGYLGAILDVDYRLIKRSKRDTINPQNRTKSKIEDISELSVIKTFISNPNMIDILLESVGEDFFKLHKDEFLLLLQDKFDDPLIIGISIRDDLVELSEDELKNQLRIFLIRYNNQWLQRIKLKSDISFKKRSFLLRKIKESLQILKSGELVPYDDFADLA